MAIADWDDVKVQPQNSSGVDTGSKVGFIGRIVYGFNQVNNSAICALGACCPAEGDVLLAMEGYQPGPQGCFALINNIFSNLPHQLLNDGTNNPLWNGCPGPGSATGYNTCDSSGPNNATPGTGTDPCACNLGEFYTALPNINYSLVGPGAQWLTVSNGLGDGQLDCCVEIIKIVEGQTNWNSGTVTCLSDFRDHTWIGIHLFPSAAINHPQLQILGIETAPTGVVETSCSSCVENLYGCLDQNAVNTYWDCNGVYHSSPHPNVAANQCCIYPGCPDSSALYYDPTNSDGCGTWSGGIWSTGGPTDTSCCQYPGCNDSISVPCGTTTLPNGDPGPIGCVANHTLDCSGNPVIPATGGILVNPAASSCWTNEIPPSPNNDCYYVGCTDSTASNHTPGANGCLFPTADGIQCCEYEGCMDQNSINYGESCDGSQIYTAAQLTGPCIVDNCVDPPRVGCMDDGCCVDGITNTVVVTPLPIGCTPGTDCICDTGLHLCPGVGGGPSVNSSWPTHNGVPCTPGVDCEPCDYDPAAEEHDPNMCICSEGVYCNMVNNPGCIPGTDCCIDIHSALGLSYPYNWSDPMAFGPCGPGLPMPCTGTGSALEDCQRICVQEELEECAVFMNDRQGNVYFYGPPDTNPNNLTFLFHDDQFDEQTLPDGTHLSSLNLGWDSGTGSWDIANAHISGTMPPNEEHFVWLYTCRQLDIEEYLPDGITSNPNFGQIKDCNGSPCGIIREYKINIDPFLIDPGGNDEPAGTTNPTYVRDIDITNICQTMGVTYTDQVVGLPFQTIGAALVAQDEDELISVGDRALKIDISTNTATATELFMLPGGVDGAGNVVAAGTRVPNVDGATVTYQGRSTGDVVIDVDTGALTITYNTTNPKEGNIGKFSNNAGFGQQLLYSNGNASTWYETVSNTNLLTPGIFGLFKWNGLWYGSDATPSGGQVYDYDNNTMTVNSLIGTVTTLPPSNLVVTHWSDQLNEIVGASQKDGCTPDDPCCCDDPVALNYVPGCMDPDPVNCPCIYPPEPRMGCLPRLTKEEYMMGVVQKQETYSDVFIERGKVSVFERPQRLAQVSTIGELELHGYGYYNILIQE